MRELGATDCMTGKFIAGCLKRALLQRFRVRVKIC